MIFPFPNWLKKNPSYQRSSLTSLYALSFKNSHINLKPSDGLTEKTLANSKLRAAKKAVCAMCASYE